MTKKEQRRKYYLEHRQDAINYAKQWQKNNYEKNKTNHREYMRKYNQVHYHYEKKRKYALWNKTDEVVMNSYQEIMDFLGIPYWKVKVFLQKDLIINGWKGERIL